MATEKIIRREKETDDLRLFNEIWYQIFLYCLATTVLMHVIAAVVSLRSIRKHRVCRYLPVVLIIAGFLYPLTGGMITSAWIAWIYTVAGYPMAKWYAFVYGAGQALCLLIISFFPLFGTL